MRRRLDTGKRLVIASHNAGKVREIAALLAPYRIAVIDATTVGLPEPEETGDSFVANAELKSRAGAGQLAAESDDIVLADDSGLAVTALDGAPGIYSARWAGPERDFGKAMALVQEKLADTADRRACFVSVLSLAWPDGQVQNYEGTVAGYLTWPPRGDRGFGYDPMFVPDGYEITFGEMDPDEKHRISHRAVAFGKMIADCLATNDDDPSDDDRGDDSPGA